MKEERLTREIPCVTASGKKCIIIEYQTIIDGDIKGIKSLKTENGLDVNYINSETFKIVITDEIVRKIT